jgi:hypothetical protein
MSESEKQWAPVPCLWEGRRIWYERAEGGCFDFAACLARRYPDCRRKHLTEDPAVAAFVQGLKNSFSGESGKVADTHRSV